MLTKVYKPLWLATTIVGFKKFKNICFRTVNISTIDRYMYWMVYEGYIKVKKITSADTNNNFLSVYYQPWNTLNNTHDVPVYQADIECFFVKYQMVKSKEKLILHVFIKSNSPFHVSGIVLKSKVKFNTYISKLKRDTKHSPPQLSIHEKYYAFLLDWGLIFIW